MSHPDKGAIKLDYQYKLSLAPLKYQLNYLVGPGNSSQNRAELWREMEKDCRISIERVLQSNLRANARASEKV